MDDQPQNSDNCLCLGVLPHARPFKRCCFFLIGFLFCIVAAVGLAMLTAIFVLKPREPIFSLQSGAVDWYELHVNSGSTLFLSSVVSLSLIAQNPNKIGIGYGRSQLHILFQGLPIGLIRVPAFYQPAHSSNVSFRTRVLLPCVNVSQVLENGPKNNIVQMKILGDIKVCVRVFRVTLPMVKVALDCDIIIDYKEFISFDKFFIMRVVQNHVASLHMNSGTFFRKCALAFCV